MATLQVLQWGICDQGAVVQLYHLQTVVSTGAAAEVSDAIISNQLTVGQTLQEHCGTNTDALLLNCLWKQPWHYAWKCCRSKICLSGKHTLTRTCKRGQWIDNWMSVPSVIWCKSERNKILLSEEKEKTVQPLYTILFIYLHTFF